MNPAVKPEEIVVVVKKTISEVNNIPIDDINLEDNLITDLAMDSIELIDFIIRLEKLGLILNESDLSSSLTVRHVIKKIQINKLIAFG